MTVFYYTFGCKVNQYETDAIRELMESQGYSTTDKLNLADICVINTCTVTGAADIKLKQLLHKIKSSNPSAAIAVCGCFSQAYQVSPLLSMADVIAGENNKSEVPDMIKKYAGHLGNIVVMPGEKEMQALADGAMRMLKGDEAANVYSGI